MKHDEPSLNAPPAGRAPEAAQNPYDELLYPHGAFEQTHPNRLATLATLFGVDPAPVERCRVLELGCASGGNLLPMAAGLPGSSFVGVDLSARQIEIGKAWIERLGLGNIELKAMDILDVDAAGEPFDYIIAHGVYAWVPTPVREKILALCRDRLSPRGLAYISFNVLPGWAPRRMLREMMLYASRGAPTGRERAAEARAFLRFAASSARPGPYRALLAQELARADDIDDSYLLHDDLSDHNEPLYFHSFVERAAAHGLQFVSEANFAQMQGLALPERARQALRSLDDIVMYEQYRDFFEGGSFRQAIVCREDVALRRDLRASHARSFFIRGELRPASPRPDLRRDTTEVFETASKGRIEVNAPVAKAALLHLAAIAPRALRFDALLAAAIAKLGRKRADARHEAEVLGATIMTAFSAGLLELHVYSPPVEPEPSERPTASLLARLQAAEGEQLTTLWHQNWKLTDALSRRLLPLLDGSRDRAALARAVGASSKAEIEQALRRLAMNGMLMQRST